MQRVTKAEVRQLFDWCKKQRLVEGDLYANSPGGVGTYYEVKPYGRPTVGFRGAREVSAYLRGMSDADSGRRIQDAEDGN